MSVYKHAYRPHTGEVTRRWRRIYVLVCYGAAEAWSSKITVALFVFSFLPVVIFLIGIYLANNPLARALIFKGSSGVMEIDSAYFFRMLEFQSWLALVMTAWVAPRLITFDLADNALPILLSHPISRFGYVLGKFLALFSFLSMITWVPCLLLFCYQAYSSPTSWADTHWLIAAGLFWGSLLWIVVLSMLGLALSSWVKWRVVATGAIFAAVFVPAGVGAIMSAILRTRWGFLLNVPMMMSVLWQRLLGAPQLFPQKYALPTPAILTMLLASCLCFVAMLNARIRAREVVRG